MASPVIFATLGTVANQYDRGLLATIHDAARKLSVAGSVADDLVARGIRRESIRVIYNGIDTDFFTPAPAMRSIRGWRGLWQKAGT